MKTTLRIAKIELSMLFYSPIAWFLLIVFLFQCGFAYTGVMEQFVTYQDLGGNFRQILRFLTSQTFAGQQGVLISVLGKLYLYLPLLTMGLISRELNSGTIKLLYSSPIKVREIIFGKFVAMMVYNLLMVGVLGLIVLFALFNIESADIGLMLSMLLGIYLLLCAYAAIGLFMSTLTSYQVVAAICTFAIFALLSFFGSLWQDIPFVRDLTYFLGINGRTENFTGGLVTTKDIFYFFVIVYMFLAFSIVKLSAEREAKSGWYIKVLRYAAVIVIGLFIGYLTGRSGFVGYWDTTATKTNTLTKGMQQILKETGDDPIEITSYVNLLDTHAYYGMENARNSFLKRWEPYLRFKQNIKFNFVYYYDAPIDKYFARNNRNMPLQSVARRYAKSFKLDIKQFKTPAEVHKMINLQPEKNRFVMQIRFRDRSTFLRVFDDAQQWPGETEVGAALKRMMVTLPKIGFLTGHFERSIDKIGDKDLKALTSDVTNRHALVNQGFDAVNVPIDSESIPSDITALVIADPKTPYSAQDLVKIQQYINKAGDLLIAGEPGRQALIKPILDSLDVQMADGILLQKTNDFAPDMVMPYLTAAASRLSRSLAADYRDSLQISMPGAAALSFGTGSRFQIHPLLLTDGKLSWLKKDGQVPDSMVTRSAGGRIIQGSFPTVLALTRSVRQKQQRIIVSGDADFISNAELQRFNLQSSNFDFNTAMFSWFSGGLFPIDSSRPKSQDTHINLTARGVTTLKVFFLGVFPIVLLLCGTILLIRRKRQ